MPPSVLRWMLSAKEFAVKANRIDERKDFMPSASFIALRLRIRGRNAIMRVMEKRPRHAANQNRIKPIAGVGVVLLFLATFLVFLWVVIIVVRLVVGYM